MLRTTTACTFSTSQLLKVLRSWGALCILTSKFASRHNGVQFFHLSSSWLRTPRFSEPTFRPSGATNHWTNTLFRDFPTFSRTWIVFLLRLSLFWHSFFFSSLLFSDSSHLCFSSVHIVGSLTSKLPSIMISYLNTCMGVSEKWGICQNCHPSVWTAALRGGAEPSYSRSGQPSNIPRKRCNIERIYVYYLYTTHCITCPYYILYAHLLPANDSLNALHTLLIHWTSTT